MVGKQGPQSRDGGRYVGNIGDSSVDVEIRSGSGDIRIFRLESTLPGSERTPTTSSFSDAPPRRDAEPDPLEEAPATQAMEPNPATSPTTPEQHTMPDSTGVGNDPRLAILESLKRGEISVEEASALLGSLEATTP
jgi:hypothetical protein